MKEYSITIPNGMETTVLMNDEDAKRAGLLSDTGVKAGPADPEKQPESTAAKSGAAQNKSATPENKSA